MAALRAMLQLRPGSSPDMNQPNTLLSALSTASSSSFTTTSNSNSTNTAMSSSPGHNTAKHLQAAAVIASKRPTPPAHSQNLGLHSGAASGNLGLVKFALDNGQPIDSVFNGVLAIHAACCSNSNIPVVLYLIERGADVNARRYPRKYSGERVVGAQTVGTTGSTPLHFAAANGCLQVVEILLRHGAIADLADKYGSTPSSVATARSHPEVASLLYQHACMQRGVQAIVPDNAESRDQVDPFTSPRSSSDFGRRLFGTSRLMPSPTKESTSALPTSSSSSRAVSMPKQLVNATLTTAVPPPSANHLYKATNHRRVSLPSIVESPSSPTAPTLARQSCDLGRIPLSTEPLHARSGSADARLPSPVSSVRSPSQRSLSGNYINNGAHKSSSRPPTQLDVPPNDHGSRRRSVDASASPTAFLSPKTAMVLNRRRSLDQLSAQKRPVETKTRRQSNASNAETVVPSGQSSCSTLVNPLTMLNDRNDSRTLLSGSGPALDSKLSLSNEGNPALSSLTPSTTNGILAPNSSSSSPLQQPWASDDVTKRRIMSASEPGGGPPPFKGHHERQALSACTEIEAIALGLATSEKKYRRRSMQDALWRSSSNSSSYKTSKLGSSNSTSSLLQDPSSPAGRPAPAKQQQQQQQQHRKTGSSFSGSATISGRFSRFWSSAMTAAQKEDEGEDLFVDQLKRSFNSYHQGLHQHGGQAGSDGSTGSMMTTELETKWITTTTTTSDMTGSKPANRTGVMNRLAGMWSRR
ncbi:hypothetical protein BGZ83_009610 [Gryganskiella cystojenkinii]|nr:hypothetical protein BGZ83_009610 [Gryganskiella cystojenkinii]